MGKPSVEVGGAVVVVGVLRSVIAVVAKAPQRGGGGKVLWLFRRSYVQHYHQWLLHER